MSCFRHMKVEGALLCAVALASASALAGAVFVRDRAGTVWQDGVLIGDGATAALGYAPAHFEWMVNRNDVFDSRVFKCDYVPHEEVMACVATGKVHSVAFLGPRERPTIRGPKDGNRLTLSLSAAVLRVRLWPGSDWTMPAIPRARQSLDTRTGELVECLDSQSFAAEAVSLIERSRDVMAVCVGDGRVPSRRVFVDLARPDDPRYDGLVLEWKTAEGVVCFAQRMPGGETYAVALSAPGPATSVGRTAHFDTKGRTVLFLAVRTTRDASDPAAAAIAAVQAAERDGFEKVRADNAAWWGRFWADGARASFDSEPKIDTQWHVALHNLASQFGSSPMPALNGLAYGPPGDGTGGVGSNCYVHDQNVQIPMMPFFPLGHAEFVRAFVKTYTDALPELERRTREVFGVDGAYLPLNMNPNGREAPIADYRYTLCGGAYSGLILAQAWWYTHDEALLKEVYPLLKKFIRFYTATMTKDASGTYHFIWSVPPEIFTGSRDDTATIACLKPCLEVAVEAATRFGCDAEDVARWKDVLTHYPRVARHSEGGWWCGPEIPDDHYMYGGHLFYPFFPSETDIDRETAKKTLDYTWKYAVEISHETPTPHPVHEWSAFYTGMARTRLFGGEEGWKALMDFYDNFAKPNGLFSHNSIVVTDMTREEADANVKRAGGLSRRNYHGNVVGFGRRGPNDLTHDDYAKCVVAPVLEGAAAFLMLSSEALCQSWGGKIRIFPSVPKGFTGRFENFRVRGGYRVSASMVNGKVVDFDLRGAKKGEKIEVSCPSDPDFVQLPGEPAWKKPVGHGPFPDALSAAVFRNWTLVPAATIAAAVGAEEGDIKRIASEMGLDPEAKVPAEWRRSGYVTILRRNWQLMPYPQLLTMTGMTRRDLRHALMHDDFLYNKLGKDKPDASRIRYSPELDEAGRAARLALRLTLEEEGVKIVDPAEEPRFAFVKQLAEVPDAMKGGTLPRPPDARFGRRMVFPYCADYGDVLADPEAASCSEGLIARLAECGVDTLWFHVVLSTLSTDPKYPEWGRGAARRRATLAKLVDRAAKYGVKIMLYINEPRAEPAEFFSVPGRAGMRGAVDRRTAGYYALCTEDPATLAWLEGCLRGLFSEIPGLGGVFTVTMSETTTHCASQFSGPQATCPVCRGKPYEYFVRKVNESVVRGVKGASPSAEVWFFDVGWEVEGLDRRVIPMLPKEGSLLIWSEKYLPFMQAGKMHKVTEYSISHPGPAQRALDFWGMAKKRGLGAIAKLQVSCSWEISAVPYLPAMDLVARHALSLAKSPVDGVMLSWSLGGYPSANLAVFNDFRRGDTEESLLDRAARAHYGDAAAPAVRRAWTAYSKAFSEYPIEWQTVYYSPVQMGPANLLYAEKTDWPATMVNTPYDDFAAWSDGYKDNRAGWLEQMRRVADGFERGDDLWREVVAASDGAARERAARDAVVFRAATLHFRTVVDQASFILARDRGDKVAMRKFAERELATAKEMLRVVRADSRLGYEASNRYIYVPNDFMEKVLNCRAVLAGLKGAGLIR